MKTLRAAAALLAMSGAAIAPPALAQSSGSISGGRSGSFMAPATPAPAHSRGYERGNFPLPIVPGWSDGREWRDRARPVRPGRPGRPDRPRRPDNFAYGYGYGTLFGGYIDPDRGYFAEEGDATARRGRVDYDYDRGYPYDHYRGRPARADGYETASREPYCETEWTGDRRSGQQVPVRVCRN